MVTVIRVFIKAFRVTQKNCRTPKKNSYVLKKNVGFLNMNSKGTLKSWWKKNRGNPRFIFRKIMSSKINNYLHFSYIFLYALKYKHWNSCPQNLSVFFSIENIWIILTEALIWFLSILTESKITKKKICTLHISPVTKYTIKIKIKCMLEAIK